MIALSKPPTVDRRSRIAAQLMLFGEGARALASLKDVGPVLVIKGAATADLVWSPGERTMTDIDLLVAPECFKGARAALLAAGWTVLTTRNRPLGSRVHPAFTVRSARGALIDVHAHVAQPLRWPVSFFALASRAVPFHLGRAPALRPCSEDAIVIAALNAAKDEHAQRGHSIEDIARIASLLEVDWQAVVDRSRQWRATVAVWFALERARVFFQAAVPQHILAALRPHRARVVVALFDPALPLPLARPMGATVRRVLSSRRMRQIILGPLLTDSLPRFFASALSFAAVRTLDAMASFTVTSGANR